MHSPVLELLLKLDSIVLESLAGRLDIVDRDADMTEKGKRKVSEARKNETT